MDEVANQLAESAPRFARDALRALSDGDEVRFALFAATSLEHILKSYLARQHPALIVDARSFDSLLHACGQDSAANTPRAQIRTIGAGESLKRAMQLLPPLRAQKDSLEKLFEVRNGGVHVADRGVVDPFVLPFLKASELVREVLGLDRDGYWGEFLELADRTIEDYVAAAALKASASIARARKEFGSRFDGLDPATRAAMIMALEHVTLHGDEEQPAICPACSSGAVASGTVEAEWSYNQVGDEDFEPELDATFFAETLSCRVCGLELQSVDELVAAGLETRWRIDVNPENYYDEHMDWEPDEDWLRGR